MTPTASAPNPVLQAVTARIAARSTDSRADWLARCDAAAGTGTARSRQGCTNLAHAFAASGGDKPALRDKPWPNLAIVTAYNDMLSAHQPYERFPALLKAAAREVGAVAQVAGGVPAMCDGITQGNEGMELSLFSREVIALSTAIALSHAVFDGALLLGVCDKIVPGLFMGAASFGHLPALFVPAGPMTSGLSNGEKSRVRKLFAEGKASRQDLLAAESASYHDAGTCTFYGTANTNQMLMEVMGLHLPGAAFVNPNTPLRDALTRAAAQRIAALAKPDAAALPLSAVIDERSIVNGIVGLLATGGSTNHTLHIVAMARAVGILVNWDDFSDLSAVVPLLARIYPNGKADVNHFQAAGGMAFLTRELLSTGLLHADAMTVTGNGLADYCREPWLSPEGLAWRDAPEHSGDLEVLRPVAQPFSADGGLKLLQGNLGRAVIKTSAVKLQHHRVQAAARVFDTQAQVLAAFKAGELDRDVVVVVRGQGPRANGMPELHKLTPALGVLQDRGFQVALITDGRMSGASGVVPAAIHLSPEALGGGAIAKLRDGDMVLLDATQGLLEAQVDSAQWAAREALQPDVSGNASGVGRELFGLFRAHASDAESGARSCLP